MEQWRPKFEHQVSRDLRVHLAFFSLFVALRYAASASQPPPSAFNSATLLGRPSAHQINQINIHCVEHTETGIIGYWQIR